MAVTGNSEALLQQAREHFNAGRYSEAELICREILRQHSRDGEALHIAGLVAGAAGRNAVGVALLRAAVRQQSSSAQVWYNLGVSLAECGLAAEAVDAYRRCLALAPGHCDAHRNLAGLLYRAGDAEKALPWIEQAVALAPSDAGFVLMKAKALHDLRRLDEAEPWYEKALALRPKDPVVQWEYAMQLLLTGRFERGWEYFDARVPAHSWAVSQYPFSMPAWRGQSLSGRTLLIHGEQGLGDEIMFCSIVPELLAEAKRVIIACSPTLSALFARSFPQAIIEPFARDAKSVDEWKRNAPPPPWVASHGRIDFQCPMGSLPRYRRRRMDEFIDPKPYLVADAERVGGFEQALRERIDNYERTLKVGLVWTGNLATGLMGQRKSIPIKLLSPLAAIPGVRFVSLQAADHAGSARAAPELRIIDMSQRLDTLDATAALAQNMDVVISVDTVTAHLGGALGREIWVPLWFAADWRYLDRGERGIWYSNMRLFRQTVAGDWQPVVKALQAALQERAKRVVARS